MKYCPKCDLQLDDFYEECWKCKGKLENKIVTNLVETNTDKIKQQSIDKGNNSIAVFVALLGWIVLILGGLGSIYLASIDYTFNLVVFTISILSTCVSGGLIIGVAEIINKLHSIEINTRKEVIQRVDKLPTKQINEEPKNSYIKE